MHKFADKVIALLIFAIMVPVGGALLAGSTQPTCYPVPSLLLPAFADSWSYYFNTTNNRWYNASVSSGYVTTNLYNQQIHAFDSPVINGYQPDDVYFIGITNASFTGHNVTSIKFKMARYVDGLEPTGNIQVGIFQNNSLTYTLRQTFGLFNVATLVEYDGINWDTVIGNYALGYVMQSGDIIGLKANGVGHVGTRSGLAIQVQRFSDGGITDSSIYVFNDGSTYIHGGASDNPNFYGYVKQSSLSNSTTYTLLPLTFHGVGGGSLAMTSEGRLQCNQSFTILWVIFMMAMISIVIMFLVKKKGERK